MSFANNVDWGWDLPPGCTQKDIDRASDFEEDPEEDSFEEDKAIFHRENEEEYI